MSYRDVLRDLLRRAKTEKKRAELEAELAVPPFPRSLGYLWSAFHRLRGRKGSGFSGPEPIGWPEIDAFQRQSGVRLAPWEVELIEELDDLYLKTHYENISKRREA